MARMQIQMLKSKIHRATITAANVNYEGSLSVAADLMDKVGMLPFERILCGNVTNGNRFETYAIPGEAGSGAIVLNGGVAHLGKPGEQLTIMSFIQMDDTAARDWKPRVIVLGDGNRVVSERGV